jgi:hypothetical protein
MIKINFGPISETVYIDIVLNTIIRILMSIDCSIIYMGGSKYFLIVLFLVHVSQYIYIYIYIYKHLFIVS